MARTSLLVSPSSQITAEDAPLAAEKALGYQLPRIRVKWVRGHDIIDVVRPRIVLCLGKKGGGKSAFLEACAIYHRKIVDILGSRDNENLCWLRKTANPDWKILLIHGDNVDLESSWDSCKISDLTLSKILDYDIVTTADSFYSSQKERYNGLNMTCELFWGRLQWNYPIAVIMREASNFMYSRIAQEGMDLKSAKADFIVFQRELRHMGFSPYLDTIRWTSIDKEMRDLADYLVIKKLGAQGLPHDLRYLYRWIAPMSLADLPPQKFLIHTENAAIGKGVSECPTFHKEEGIDLLTELGIQVTIGEPVEDSTQQRIGDVEHAKIVRLYAVGLTGSEGMSMDNVSAQVHRSKATVAFQVKRHNKAVAVGGCKMCSRADSDLWNSAIDKHG